MDTLKELRNETGLSIAQIKKALDEAQGDKEKARVILAAYSEASASKKADREIVEGVIASYVHTTGKVGVILELGCETDFVAKNDEFIALARDLAMHVCAMAPLTVEHTEGQEEGTSLLEQSFIKNPEMTVKQRLEGAVQKFGENTKVTRFVRYALSA